MNLTEQIVKGIKENYIPMKLLTHLITTAIQTTKLKYKKALTR